MFFTVFTLDLRVSKSHRIPAGADFFSNSVATSITQAEHQDAKASFENHHSLTGETPTRLEALLQKSFDPSHSRSISGKGVNSTPGNVRYIETGLFAKS